MRSHACLVACLVVLLGAAGLLWSSPAFADSCGIDSLSGMLQLMGVSVEPSQVRRSVGDTGTSLSLLDIRNGARRLGLGLRGVNTSLSELRENGTPAILHLREPDHFVVLVGLGSARASVLDAGALRVVEVEALARRFSGAALTPAGAVGPSSRARVREPVRAIRFTSTSAVHTEEVEVINAGVQPLDLEVAAKACSCLGVDLSSRRVPPGERVTLAVRVRSQTWGTSVESITLGTNDPLAPRLVVVLLLEMPRTVIPQPERLPIRASEGQPARREMTLLLPEGAAVTACATRNPFVSARVVGSGPVTGGIAHRVEVTVAARAPVGTFADEIAFQLKDAGVPQVSVPVDGIVEPDVTALPHQAFFGMMAAGAAAKRSVTIGSAAGHPFALRPTQPQDRRITLMSDWGAKTVRHVVTVGMLAKGAPGEIIRERVRVTMDNGRALEFSVFAMVAGADEAGGEK